MTVYCRSHKRARARAYNTSGKARAKWRAYNASEKGRARKRTYNMSEKGRERAARGWRAARARQTIEENAARDGARRASVRGASRMPGKTFTQTWRETVPLYAERIRREAETGVAHHVDHVVPIACGGLHDWANLQVVSAHVNLKKHSREMGDIFALWKRGMFPFADATPDVQNYIVDYLEAEAVARGEPFDHDAVRDRLLDGDHENSPH